MTDISMPKATRAHAEKRHKLAPAVDDAFHAFSKAVFPVRWMRAPNS